jgi:TonB family protein
MTMSAPTPAARPAARPAPRKETMSDAAMVSLVLHGLLVTLAIFPLGFSKPQPIWGDNGSGGVTTPVTLKSGIPLPAAPVENTLATDVKSENAPEKAEKTTKPKEVEPPPSKNDYLLNDKKSRQQRLKEAQADMLADAKRDLRQAENSIPGKGGRASSDMYNQSFPTSQGSGGLNFGGDFGARYGLYVRTVRACITRNWDRSHIDSVVRGVPKAFVAFDIQKDGSIANEHVTTTSGAPSFDREAVRAVQACSGRNGADHLPPLPHDFEDTKISVEVWFEAKQ